MLAPGVDLERERAAVGDAQRGLSKLSAQALAQAVVQVAAQLHAVDDDVDVVLLGLLQARQVRASTVRAVDAEADEALRLHVGEQFGELALAVAHHRREHRERVSSGSASTASTIWLTLCAASGRSWSGQNGVPARA